MHSEIYVLDHMIYATMIIINLKRNWLKIIV